MSATGAKQSPDEVKKAGNAKVSKPPTKKSSAPDVKDLYNIKAAVKGAKGAESPQAKPAEESTGEGTEDQPIEEVQGRPK